MYLTYLDYTEYGGQMKEADFIRFSFMAEKYIDKCTFDRLRVAELCPENVPEEVKRCVYELCERMAKTTQTKGIASESQTVGNISESRSYTEYDTGKAEKEYIRLVEMYLSGVRVNGRQVLGLAI